MTEKDHTVNQTEEEVNSKKAKIIKLLKITRNQ